MAYEFNDDELRMLSVSAPVVLRMLEKREKTVTDKIYGNFRNGELDHTAHIAEMCAYRDLQTEIKNALNRHKAE